MKRERLIHLVADWLPDRRSLVLVFGSAAFLTYTWTVLVSFWKIPSWLFFLNASQIFSIYAYSFLVNLIESILLTAVAVFLRGIVPGRWWKDDFVPLSVITFAGIVAGLNIWIQQYGPSAAPRVILDGQFGWIMAVSVSLLALAFLFHKIGFLKSAAAAFADRTVIFLYIYLPVTALSLVAIALRAWL